MRDADLIASVVAGFPGAVTVSDASGVILTMNPAAVEQYAAFGGADLLGTNMLDCHPEPSRTTVAEMLDRPGVNVYTIEKGGSRRLIYQATWYEGSEPAGLVEVSLELPAEMPHRARD